MNVLIVRVGAMGDVLHTLPAVAALRAARPDWRIDWAVDERWVPLLRVGASSPVVSNLHVIPTRAWSRSPLAPATFGSVRTLRRALRAARYDLVVDMQGSIRSAVIGRLAGAPQFAGFADPREAPARRLYKQKVERRGVHVVEQNIALLAAATRIDLTPPPSPHTLPRDAQAEAWADALVRGRRLCLIAPTAGWGAKQWPAERFGELAAALTRIGLTVFINAAGNDASSYAQGNFAANTGDTAAMCAATASGGAAEIVPCSLPQLTALLRRAALYIGGDTGPTHLAAALGTPLVALYGPTNPARNGPWGAGPMRVLRHNDSTTSHKRVEEIDRGLARIDVAEALAAASDLLGA